MEKRFADPVVTSVRVERKLYELAKSLGIELTYATKKGLEGCIENSLEEYEKNHQITPDMVIRYRELLDQYYTILEKLVKERGDKEKVISNLQEKAIAQAEKQEKDNKLLYVWDMEEEKHKWIRAVYYTPILHQIITPPKQPEGDE